MYCVVGLIGVAVVERRRGMCCRRGASWDRVSSNSSGDAGGRVRNPEWSSSGWVGDGFVDGNGAAGVSVRRKRDVCSATCAVSGQCGAAARGDTGVRTHGKPVGGSAELCGGCDRVRSGCGEEAVGERRCGGMYGVVNGDGGGGYVGLRWLAALGMMWLRAGVGLFDVQVFGSYATGLCLSQSDVDVVVVDAPPPVETAETAGLTGTRLLAPSIRLLGSALGEYGWCKSIATIESATMPVIKLHCRPRVGSADGEGRVVKIDITIGGKKMGGEGVGALGSSEGGEGGRAVNPNYEAASRFHNGAAAREYVIQRLQQQPALAPLVFECVLSYAMQLWR